MKPDIRLYLTGIIYGVHYSIQKCHRPY